MSGPPFLSSSVSGAQVVKLTYRPSALIEGPYEQNPRLERQGDLTCRSWESIDAIVISPVRRSKTKTSSSAFVSPMTRLAAELANAMKRPSAEIAGCLERVVNLGP